MEEIQFNKIYIKLANRPQMEMFKNVTMTKSGVTMTLSKSFTTAAQANRQGLIGILMNKLFSSMMKTEEFEFSFLNVKKVEIASNKISGRLLYSIMFWNVKGTDANYENIDFSISPSDKEIDQVKTFLEPLFTRVEFKELETTVY